MPDLAAFFQRYARLSTGGEPEPLAECYDTAFLVAGPKGVATFANDASFRAWLREVRAFNETSGMTSLAPGEIVPVPVGGGYTLATVEWTTTFRRTRDTPIRFRISYLLRESGDGWKISGYVSHEDQEEAMRRHGVLEQRPH